MKETLTTTATRARRRRALALLAPAALIILLLAAFLALAAPPAPPTVPPDTPPVPPSGVVLNQPADRAYLKSSTVVFNFTAYLDVDGNCTLFLNDSPINYWKPGSTGIIASGTAFSYTKRSLKDGDYYWSASCYQSDGSEEDSATFDFTVDTSVPALVVSPTSVEQGDPVELNGSHYLHDDVFVNVSNASGVIDQASYAAGSDGSFSGDYYLRYDAAPGAYTFTTYQDGYAAATVSKGVSVVARAVSVFTDKDSYAAGETVKVFGDGFSSGSPVNIKIDKPDGGMFPTQLIAAANGTFSYSYLLNGQRAPGTYSITATDSRYPLLSASASFTLGTSTQNTTITPPPPPETGAADYDKDGVADSADNCPTVYNPDQADKDGDGLGDACDPKDDSATTLAPNLDDNSTAPPQVQQPKGSGVSLLLLGVLGILLVAGGTVGYLAYEGKLDFSDLAGSFMRLLHPETKGSGSAADPAADEELKHFIFSERAQGYDDLAIRNSLLERGWGEKDVDAVFQEVYTE